MLGLCVALPPPHLPLQVITGSGSSALTAGAERDEVYVKYKCGVAPEVHHMYVLLYLDRLLARPVEIWQVGVYAGGAGEASCHIWAYGSVWEWKTEYLNSDISLFLLCTGDCSPFFCA